MEPRQKTLLQKQKNLRFAMELSTEDPKEEVLKKQELIRRLLMSLRGMERKFYLMLKEAERGNDQGKNGALIGMERNIEDTKEKLYEENEALKTIIRSPFRYYEP